MVTVLSMIDFSLAFNSIGWLPILKFCRCCNFSDEAIFFLYNYLHGRSFFLSNPDETYPMTSGIPQGTGPGPVLYIGGTNEFAQHIFDSFFKFFVDDYDIYQHCSVEHVTDTIKLINLDINRVVSLASSIGIDVNVNKSFAMILGSTYNLNRLKEMDIPQLIINNTAIPFVTTCKNLGIMISHDLTWNDQISRITSKVNAVLHTFYLKTKSLPVNVKILLANHLIQPHFDYACIAYDSLSDYLDGKLLKLQNRCIRYIYNLRRDQSVVIFRKKLRWLTPRDRRTFCIGILTYKLLTYKRPNYLYQSLIQHKSFPTRALRSNSKFFDTPFSSTATFDSTFQIRAIKLWNDLPIEIVSVSGIGTFRSKLLKHLLDDQKV